MVYVDLEDARAYAAWAGKRLPTEWEWQRAAEGHGQAFDHSEVFEWTESERDDGHTRFVHAPRRLPLPGQGLDLVFSRRPAADRFACEVPAVGPGAGPLGDHRVPLRGDGMKGAFSYQPTAVEA